MKKLATDDDLRKLNPKPNAMDAVTNVGDLTQGQVESYLAGLSNEDRAKLILQAILATKTGRRY